MDLGLNGKRVLVTGSTKGLGLAIAEGFSKEGADVILSGRNPKECMEKAAALQKTYGTQAAGLPCDLSIPGEAEKLFDESLARLGGLDILVNNAGIWPTDYIETLEPEAFEKTLFLNLEVPYRLSRRMVHSLREEKRPGVILNITSQAAYHGSTTGHSHYAASKAGLVTFSKSLARECAKDGIRVNCVIPGMMDTPMAAEALKARPDYYNSRIPVGYPARPEQVAACAVFLAGEPASYLTGMSLDATGGMLMR